MERAGIVVLEGIDAPAHNCIAMLCIAPTIIVYYARQQI